MCLLALCFFRMASIVLSDFVRSYLNLAFKASAGSVVPISLSAAVSVACGLLAYVQLSVMPAVAAG
jgi:hypothetical protein